MQASDIKHLPTLCTAQCCSLKIEQGGFRVWLCRVAGGITVEKLTRAGWRILDGGCTSPSVEAEFDLEDM